jgi:hypothetical protein
MATALKSRRRFPITPHIHGRDHNLITFELRHQYVEGFDSLGLLFWRNTFKHTILAPHCCGQKPPENRPFVGFGA